MSFNTYAMPPTIEVPCPSTVAKADRDRSNAERQHGEGYARLAIRLNYIIFIFITVFGSSGVSQFVHTVVSRTESMPNISQHSGVSEVPVTCHSSREGVTQQKSSLFILYLTIIEKVCTLPFIVLGGVYSDFLGRKRFLYVPVLGYSFRFILTGFVYKLQLDIRWMWLAAFVNGACGTSYLFSVLIMASMADVTSSHERSLAFVVLEGLLGITVALSVLVQGYVITYLGFNYVFWLSAAACLLLCIVIHFSFPDTSVNAAKTFPKICEAVRNFPVIIQSTTRIKPISKCKLSSILMAYLFIVCALISRGDLERLYVLGQPFCWSMVHIGIYDCVKDVYNHGTGIICAKVMKRFLRDETIVMWGIVSFAMFCLFLYMAISDLYIYIGKNQDCCDDDDDDEDDGDLKDESVMYGDLVNLFFPFIIGAALSLLSATPLSCIEGIVSKNSLKHKQGALNGNFYFLRTLVALGSYSIFNTIYAETQYISRGLVFLVMMGISLLGLLSMTLFMCQKGRECEYTNIEADEPNLNSNTIIQNRE